MASEYIENAPGSEFLKGLLGVFASAGNRGAEGVCGRDRDTGSHQGHSGGTDSGGAEKSGRASSGDTEQRGGVHFGENW